MLSVRCDVQLRTTSKDLAHTIRCGRADRGVDAADVVWFTTEPDVEHHKRADGGTYYVSGGDADADSRDHRSCHRRPADGGCSQGVHGLHAGYLRRKRYVHNLRRRCVRQ
jgi:hypothetical protein